MDREPAVAGLFYPKEPAALRAEVARLVGETTSDEPAIAIVAPHAGYVYSGAVAGEVYRAIRVPDVAIVMCPNHTGLGARAAIVSSGAFALPGARVPIASDVAADLAAGVDGVTEDRRAHAREHALEVQLPFLVARNPDVSLVPLCLGPLSLAECRTLGHGVAEAAAERAEAGKERPLLVASTDMSHYIPADRARTLDTAAIERIEALDPEGLYRTVVENDISMCGFVPTTVALFAAIELGAVSARLVRYGNSGETSGDYDRVVGYAGLVIR